MNKIFDKARKDFGNGVVDYAQKVFGIFKKAPLPAFTKYNGSGSHPDMLDPYWAGEKDVPKYASKDEWLSDVAVSFSIMLASTSNVPDGLGGSYPLPTQKTVNDWLALSTLKDGSFNYSLSSVAMKVAFLYNKEDDAFSALVDAMTSGNLRPNELSMFAELLESGEFFHPSLIDNWGIDFSQTKHPFWKEVAQKMDEYNKNPDSVSKPLPEGTPVNPDNLPLPDNDGGLLPSVDLPQSQIDQLVELYIGYFGRAAEHDGLEYWKNDLDNLLKSGLNENDAFEAISNNFWLAATEYGSATGYDENMSEIDFVTKVYTNVLGRPDVLENDREGVEYWTKELTDHGVSKGKLVLMMIKGAHYYIDENPDDAISIYVDSLLENRTDISLFFAQESISGGMSGYDAIKMGVDVINRIDDNKSTVDDVKNALSNGNLYDLPEIDLIGTGTVPTFDGFIM